MRSHMIRAGIAAVAASVALAACASHGLVPSSSSGLGQSALSPIALSDVQSDKLTTCATSPPQYWWLYKGACAPKITLKSTGASFTLAQYDSITIKGSIGHNTTKGTATITLADATDTNGDITKWKGKTFPKYVPRGKTFVYAVAVNQSNQTIKPVTGGKVPVLQYVITDTKGLPGKTCGVALLTETTGGKFTWSPFPGSFPAKGNTVTITQYAVPKGFEIPPKTPLYFGVNCYTAG